MNTITIEGQLRTGFGKGATRQLRSQEQVPGVIYGGAQEVNFYAPAAAFKPFIYTPKFQFAEIKVDGKSYKCILKDLQFDKVSDSLIHIDLMELVEDKKVVASIPVRITGNAKGVKDGGKLHVKMKALKVKTYPKFLKEQIDVNVDALELNGNIRVEDVKEENFEILNSPRIPIASVTLTRELKQEEAAAAPAAAATPAAGTAAPAAAAEKTDKAADKGKK
ncbi:MAG: 50S ribosomal protein L25 [Bacteroidetes bacterium]|nr:50S ribosomal protein L25 [Bacteroidota bacterium]